VAVEKLESDEHIESQEELEARDRRIRLQIKIGCWIMVVSFGMFLVKVLVES